MNKQVELLGKMSLGIMAPNDSPYHGELINNPDALIKFLEYSKNELNVILTQVVSAEISFGDFIKNFNYLIKTYNIYSKQKYFGDQEKHEYINNLFNEFNEEIKSIRNIITGSKVLAGPNLKVFLEATKLDLEQLNKANQENTSAAEIIKLKNILLEKLIVLYIFQNNKVTIYDENIENKINYLIHKLNFVLLHHIKVEDNLNPLFLSALAPSMVAFLENELQEYIDFMDDIKNINKLETSRQRYIDLAIDLNALRDWLMELHILSLSLQKNIITVYENTLNINHEHKFILFQKLKKLEFKCDSIHSESTREMFNYADIYIRTVLNREIKKNIIAELVPVMANLKKTLAIILTYSKFNFITELQWKEKMLKKIATFYNELNHNILLPKEESMNFYFSLIDEIIDKTRAEELKDILLKSKDLRECAYKDLLKKVQSVKKYRRIRKTLSVVHYIYLFLDDENKIDNPLIPKNEESILAIDFIRKCGL